MKNFLLVLFFLGMAFSVFGSHFELEQKAFDQSWSGEKTFPVWQVGGGQSDWIIFDGLLNEPQWDSAQTIWLYGGYPFSRKDETMASGLKNVLSVWRMLYDNEFLYWALIFYDDFQGVSQENEVPLKEEISISIQPANHMNSLFLEDYLTCNFEKGREYFKSWRIKLSEEAPRNCYAGFIQIPGIPKSSWFDQFCAHFVDPLFYDSGARRGSWDNDSLYLSACSNAEVKMRRLPSQGQYQNNWSMEMRVPLKEFSDAFASAGYTDGSYPPIPSNGHKFRMFLGIRDQDVRPDSSDSISGLYSLRRSLEWLTDPKPIDYAYSGIHNPKYFTTFAFAGDKTKTFGPVWKFTPNLIYYYGIKDSIPDSLKNRVDSTNVDAYFQSFILEGLSPVKFQGPKSISDRFISAYPNPLMRKRSVRFFIPGKDRLQRMSIFDVSGKKVFGRKFEIGERNLTWNGKDFNNQLIPNGLYIVKIKASEKTFKTRVLLVD